MTTGDSGHEPRMMVDRSSIPTARMIASVSDSAGKLVRPKTPAGTERRIERERDARDQLSAAYDDPEVRVLRAGAVAASLALDSASGPALNNLVARRWTAVTALAEALRSRAPKFARLEPDLRRRVESVGIEEPTFAIKRNGYGAWRRE